MTAAVRTVAVGWALLSLWLVMLCFIELSMKGFPDGYISPYARETAIPMQILAWLLVAQSLYFLFRGLRARLKFASLALQIAVAAALTLAPMQIVQSCPHWNACSQAYQSMTGTMLDDGAGG